MINLAAALNNPKDQTISNDETDIEALFNGQVFPVDGEFAAEYVMALSDTSELPVLLESEIPTTTLTPDKIIIDELIQETPQENIDANHFIQTVQASTTIAGDVIKEAGKIDPKLVIAEHSSKPLLTEKVVVAQNDVEQTTKQVQQTNTDKPLPQVQTETIEQTLNLNKTANTPFNLEQLNTSLFNKRAVVQDNKIQLNTETKTTTPQGILQQYQQLTSDTHNTVQQPVKISQAFNHPDWQQGFGERMVWLGQQQLKAVSIQLNPPELGPLDVKIKLEQHQTSILFSSAHAPVREAIEEALPRLRELFNENDLTLGDVDISDHSETKNKEQQNFFAESSEQHQEDANNIDGNQSNEEVTLSTQISSGLVDRYV